MRPSAILLLLSALALLLSVAFGQPQTDTLAAVSPPAADATIQLAPPAETDANLNINSAPLVAADVINNTYPNATNPANLTSTASRDPSADRALSALLASLDTSQLTPAQRASSIAAELERIQILSDQPMSVSDRRRLAATMDSWLQLSAAEKLAMMRQQQSAYVRAMHLEERRRVADMVRAMEELRQAKAEDEDAEADDGNVRRVRLIRVHPTHTTAAEFAASQMDPMADFTAQQMELPAHLHLLQLDERYGVY